MRLQSVGPFSGSAQVQDVCMGPSTLKLDPVRSGHEQNLMGQVHLGPLGHMGFSRLGNGNGNGEMAWALAMGSGKGGGGGGGGGLDLRLSP